MLLTTFIDLSILSKVQDRHQVSPSAVEVVEQEVVVAELAEDQEMVEQEEDQTPKVF